MKSLNPIFLPPIPGSNRVSDRRARSPSGSKQQHKRTLRAVSLLRMYVAPASSFPKLLHLRQQKDFFLPNSQLGVFSVAQRVSELRINSRKRFFLGVIMSAGSQNKKEVELEEESFDDEYYMRRCVELAKKAIGHTNPNPMVGCVIVKDGKIVGEGFHPKAGEPHAEVFAIRDAGDKAENGTAYVSLEPCNHYGRTPPCTEALIKAKVKNVVIGMVDPNPIVASTGVKRLQEAGVKVTVGVEEELCKRLNEVFVHHILTKIPFVTLRYSMSLDGHILNHLDDEAVECGGYYSRLMQEYDAVILSSSALSEKSSFPISKEPGPSQPLKIVLSKSFSSQIQIPVLDEDEASNFIIVSDKESCLEPQEGIQTLTFDRINLLEILENCKRLGLCSVLLDLRGDIVEFEDLLKEGFELNLFHKVVVEVLPVFEGRREKVLSHVDLKAKAKKLTSFVSGKSVILEGYF